MDDENADEARAHRQPPEPSPDLVSLDRLVDAWEVAGAQPGEEIRTRFYDNLGNTLDYVYEIEGDALKIWAGEKGSPAYYEGTFGNDGDTLSGEWVCPGGGGYASTATRIE